MSVGYEEGVYRAVLASLKAAQAVGQPLAFVGANSLFDSAFPHGDFIASLPPGSFPAIGMEPDLNIEKFFTVGTPPALESAFALTLFLVVIEANAENQLLGDSSLSPAIIGLFEFARRVKNVLQADMTLGGAVGLQKLLFPRTKYVYEFFPVRVCELSVLLTGQLTTTSH